MEREILVEIWLNSAHGNRKETKNQKRVFEWYVHIPLDKQMDRHMNAPTLKDTLISPYRIIALVLLFAKYLSSFLAYSKQ